MINVTQDEKRNYATSAEHTVIIFNIVLHNAETF